MKRIIVIGGGGHAKVVISLLKKSNIYNIIGYTDIENRGELLGVKYLGTDKEVITNKNFHKIECAVLGIGQLKNCSLRKKLIEKYEQENIKFPEIVSTDAIINEDVQIEEGTVIMDGVIVNTGSKIGRYSIINTGAIIEHDCIIGNFTHLAPGVVLSGNTIIGNETLLGTGARIINNIKVTDNVILAAGSSLHENISIPGMYIGVPAKLLRAKK